MDETSTSFHDLKEHEAEFLWLGKWHMQLHQLLFTTSEVRLLDGEDCDPFDFSLRGAPVDTETAIGLQRGHGVVANVCSMMSFRATFP